MSTEEEHRKDLLDALTALTKAVTKIAHGDSIGPTGIETLLMAIQGEGHEAGASDRNLADVLYNCFGEEGTVTLSLDRIAEELQSVNLNLIDIESSINAK
jgi:hypothetical protein